MTRRPDTPVSRVGHAPMNASPPRAPSPATRIGRSAGARDDVNAGGDRLDGRQHLGGSIAESAIGVRADSHEGELTGHGGVPIARIEPLVMPIARTMTTSPTSHVPARQTRRIDNGWPTAASPAPSHEAVSNTATRACRRAIRPVRRSRPHVMWIAAKLIAAVTATATPATPAIAKAGGIVTIMTATFRSDDPTVWRAAPMPFAAVPSAMTPARTTP